MLERICLDWTYLCESRRDHNIREHDSHPTLAFLALMILSVLLLLIIVVRARARGVLGVVFVRSSIHRLR
jgi:CHASE1-domain containing sensor protein